MEEMKIFFEDLYEKFNQRKIADVVSQMTDNVIWANGMDGGYVYGRYGVTEYWTRQFNMVSSNVSPIEISREDGKYKIRVHQVVHDLDGNLLADETVYHYFQLDNDKIARFEIGGHI
jgi:hypothetical protein